MAAVNTVIKSAAVLGVRGEGGPVLANKMLFACLFAFSILKSDD